MRRPTQICLLISVLISMGAASLPAQTYSYAVTGLVGVGGSFDESDAGYGNLNWQLGFSNEIGEKTLFAARLGGLNWGSEDLVGDVIGPSLTYLTVAGEYRESRQSFSGSFVEPGIYLGLGYYFFDGDNAEGESISDSAPGLAVGLTGDIALNRRRSLTLRVEFAAHYAALSTAQLFGMAQLGLSYHF